MGGKYVSFFLLLFLLWSDVAAAAETTDEAQRVYRRYGAAVYQVQVIDVISGKKNGIGSGFQFTADGLIATNYHVVAEALQRPDASRLEYLHGDDGKGALTILAVDVVHDLAIVKMDKPQKTFLELGSGKKQKGTRLFSLGNPHDLGFTIVEGTYNGFATESFIDKIHFSGAINPGMSGGPVVGHDGRVVGVNVATAGNEIGFLVPVEPLIALHKTLSGKTSGPDNGVVERQLLKNEQNVVDNLLKKDWESVPFGPFMVPGRIHAAFKCWGNAAYTQKDPFKYFQSTCSSQDEIFLDDDFSTGTMTLRSDYLIGNPDLDLSRFYAFYQQEYATPTREDQSGEDHVTNYDCTTRFVEQAGHLWKTSFCARRYKKYPGLYDMMLVMALLDRGREGMILSLEAAGVSKDSAQALSRRFLNEIRLKPES